jgi:hypothetical protein
MFFLYIISLVFVALGAIAWTVTKKIDVLEWAIGSTFAFLLAGVFHMISFWGQTSDVEMWRGRVLEVIYYPEWVEEYEDTEQYQCGTDSKGNVEYCIRYVTRYRTHNEYWEAKTNIDIAPRITKQVFQEIGERFGNNMVKKKIHKSGFYKGDPNVYFYKNESGWVEPANDIKKWTNRLKAVPSVYDFPPVSKEQSKMLFEWPKNNDWRNSNTLIGNHGSIDSLTWDQMAAHLGPMKQSNVIFIGFPKGTPQNVAQWQQAYWSGGKKNDVVICAAVDGKSVEWVYSFGWSNNSQVWADLNSLILKSDLTNDLVPLIKNVIVTSYERKEWADFNHLQISPPMWVFWVYPLIMFLTQGVLYVYFHNNDVKQINSRIRNCLHHKKLKVC